MIIIFLKMTIVQGKGKEVHTKIRCKSEFLQKNNRKERKDYLAKYNQKSELIAKKRNSKGIRGYYRHKPETNTLELFAIERYFDDSPKKNVSEKLDDIFKNNLHITEKEIALSLLGIVYGLLNEKGMLPLGEIYPTQNLRGVIDKMTENYSRNDGEEYIAMLTRYHIQSEEEILLSQNIYK